MENKFVRKNKMYGNVQIVLRKNESIWGNSVLFKEDVESLDAKMEKIKEKNQEQTSSKSVSEEKKQVIEKLVNITLLICSAGVAHASKINDNGLKTKFDFSKSDLQLGYDVDVYTRCKKIGEAAEPIMENLKQYNLPADQLLLLAQTSALYEKLIDAPLAVRTFSKDAREDMVNLFAECDALLNDRLDNMMLLYKDSHAEFYTEYINARFIGGWKKKKGDGTQDKK